MSDPEAPDLTSPTLNQGLSDRFVSKRTANLLLQYMSWEGSIDESAGIDPKTEQLVTRAVELMVDGKLQCVDGRRPQIEPNDRAIAIEAAHRIGSKS